MLAIQRSVAVESGEGTRDGLRLSGIDPAGIFLGKAAAVGLQLLALQAVLWVGVTFLFDVRVQVVWLAVVASLLATVGLAAPGVLYGALSAGLRVRDTLLPLLVLPVLAPVLLAGSKVWAGRAERERGVGDASGSRSWSRSPSSTSSWASSSTDRSRRRHDGDDRAARGRAGSTSSASSAWSRWASPCGSACGSRRPTRSRGTWPGCSTSTPPIATVALYWVGIVAAGGSLLYLWPRTRSFFWDRLAAASPSRWARSSPP